MMINAKLFFLMPQWFILKILRARLFRTYFYKYKNSKCPVFMMVSPIEISQVRYAVSTQHNRVTIKIFHSNFFRRIGDHILSYLEYNWSIWEYSIDTTQLLEHHDNHTDQQRNQIFPESKFGKFIEVQKDFRSKVKLVHQTQIQCNTKSEELWIGLVREKTDNVSIKKLRFFRWY